MKLKAHREGCDGPPVSHDRYIEHLYERAVIWRAFAYGGAAYLHGKIADCNQSEAERLKGLGEEECEVCQKERARLAHPFREGIKKTLQWTAILGFSLGTIAIIGAVIGFVSSLVFLFVTWRCGIKTTDDQIYMAFSWYAGMGTVSVIIYFLNDGDFLGGSKLNQ